MLTTQAKPENQNEEWDCDIVLASWLCDTSETVMVECR
jgi:hypothetical protein